MFATLGGAHHVGFAGCIRERFNALVHDALHGRVIRRTIRGSFVKDVFSEIRGRRIAAGIVLITATTSTVRIRSGFRGLGLLLLSCRCCSISVT